MKKNKFKILSLLKELHKMLNVLNDGSFEIKDLDTPKVLNL